MVHIVGITGSLRKASVHTGILRAIQKNFPAGHTFEIVVPDMPLYNGDVEAKPPLPEQVQQFRAKIKKADGFIFANTEYNYSMSGVLKNAIDWGSRGDKDGNLFNDKPCGSISAGGNLGGARSGLHLADSCVFVNMHMMNHPQFFFRYFENAKIFNTATGDVADPESEANMKKFADAFIVWALRINNSRAK
jgi:chromate reductase